MEIYRFENTWWQVEEGSHWKHWLPGFNVVIFDSSGSFVDYHSRVRSHGDMPLHLFDGGFDQTPERHLTESEKQQIEEELDSLERKRIEERKELKEWKERFQEKFLKGIIDSKLTLKQGESTQAKLNIQLEEEFDDLKRGNYVLQLYYVQNLQILDVIGERPENLFIGQVKANEVILTVE